jgi:siroheme synthase
MGVARRDAIASQLIEGGLSRATPVAVIENAWTERQRETRATLTELGVLDVASPAIIVIGPCAALSLRDVLVDTRAIT